MSKGLTKFQKEVMDKLFEGHHEKDVLQECKISVSLYRRWLRSEKWVEEFKARLEDSKRQASLTIAVYQPLAAAKLVQLMESDKEQVSRQAALDILEAKPIGSIDVQEAEDGTEPIDSKQAAKAMKVIAGATENPNI